MQMRMRLPTLTLSMLPISGLTLSLVVAFAGADLEGSASVFEDVTEASGLAGGGFVAWADYNNDGYLDVATSGRLYRNNRDGTFSRVDSFPGDSGVWGDWDNDGWLDFYSFSGQGKLIRNLGGDRFAVMPISPNIHERSRAAAWADANNDGFIDLLVTNYEDGNRAFPDLLYISRGDGSFAEPVNYPPKGKWKGRSVSWADFDNDGDQDFYVGNYRIMPNQLWVNDGGGKFTEEAKRRGVRGSDDEGEIPGTDDFPAYKASGHTIGTCFGDLNNDGHLDLVVINFSHPPAYQDRTMVCINSGPPAHTFSNINRANAAGIYWQESYAKAALGDYDNDGDLDLYITTVYEGDNGTLFENDGTGRFKDVGIRTGTRGGNTYGVAWIDYDNDGDLDLHAGGRLLRNLGNRGSWLKVTAIGDRRSNRSGIGARVTVMAGDKTIIREISGGNSNQSGLVAHFGLGRHDAPVTVSVRFPTGKVVVLTSESRRHVAVKESHGLPL